MVDEEDERVKVGLKDGREGSLKGNASQVRLTAASIDDF
jgi:hypothetical protein